MDRICGWWDPPEVGDMEAVGRVWEALDKLSLDSPEQYKQASANLLTRL